MDATIHPYVTAPRCCKCGSKTMTLRYSESHLTAGIGEYICTMQRGMEPEPKLIVTCDVCRYSWLMACADSKDTSTLYCRVCGHDREKHVAWDPSRKRYVCQACPCTGFVGV